ncbi:hypothetical protein CQA40_01420 [Helicobacter sp. MIT 01-3238]|nr:hypothetical protein CQA40_01420 [Helicobacter sp. MIT 01-3238]
MIAFFHNANYKIHHYYVPLFALGIIAQMLCFKSCAKAQNICFKKLVNIDFDIMQNLGKILQNKGH